MEVAFYTPERVRAHEVLQAAWRADLDRTNPVIRFYRRVSSSFSDFCGDIYRLMQPVTDAAAADRTLLQQIREAAAAIKSCPSCQGIGARSMIGVSDYSKSTYAETQMCRCVRNLMELVESTLPAA